MSRPGRFSTRIGLNWTKVGLKVFIFWNGGRIIGEFELD